MFSPLSFPSTSNLTRSQSLSKPRSSILPSSTSAQQVSDNASTITRTAVSLEYASVIAESHCPLGMYILPSAESIMIWDGVLFVHQGYYSDAILKFKLSFPSKYPERPPKVQFITEVFHPLAAPDGTFNITPQIRTWLPGQHHVFDILHFIKAAFKSYTIEKLEEGDCFNKEAYRFHDSTSSFAALASQSASLSKSSSSLFDADQPIMTSKPPHSMKFLDLDAKVLKQERERCGLKSWSNTEDK
ncbi:UBC-like protein [Marasmius fiardii PR-910]|nr:UBC-like protein [Marasmius fiardii PR-910]